MSDSNKIRVILADDKEIIRQGIRAILTRTDEIQLVGEAADGEEAVALVAKLSPEIALIDIEMPCVDGIDAAKAIQKNFQKVSVIFLSCYADRGFIHVLDEMGFSNYIIKDEAIKTLIPTILVVAAKIQKLAEKIELSPPPVYVFSTNQ